jgi:lipopolysaccharide export system protein LptC
MLDSKQLTLIFLLIVAVGFSGWWLLHHQHENANKQLINTDPDSFAEQVTVVNMDVDGQPSSQFSAKSMVHYPGQNMTLAQQPRLVLYMKEQQPWYITAEQGKALDGDQVITLWNNVQFKQAAGKSEPESLILTEAFTFLPKQNIGKTDKAVTMLQPGIKITAIGLLADTATGKINLLHDVRGSYAAQN